MMINKIFFRLCACLCAASLSTSVGAADDTQSAALDPVEVRVEKILSSLSLEEKIGQLTLSDWGFANKENLDEMLEAVRKGTVGGYLNIPRNPHFPDAFDMLQKIAVDESPAGIPLIFGHDVIHGYKTIFPIPLGQASSWDARVVERGARIAAVEATSAGIRWTFAPMIDISRDARWGRIAESLGEDVMLTSVLAAAMVRGFQGDDLSSSDSLAACAKHFVAYGAVEGGRDYNASYVPEGLLRDVYLPPFKAAIDAGALSLMSSYNDVNGVPATANKMTLTGVLRDEWAFDGFVVSDWNSVLEMIPHGFARDDSHAAAMSVNAGIDFEMQSDSYKKHLPALLADGTVSISVIDEAVRRMLRAKVKMGLFEKPYTDTSRRSSTLSDEFLAAAREAARRSFVLLKNDSDLLPLNKKQKIAVIGPLAEVPYQQLGTWIYEGDKKDSRTLLPALRQYLGDDSRFSYAPGLAYSRSRDTSLFDEAVAVAEKSDVIVFFGGEEAILSGEGHSRGDISLPGAQRELFNRLQRLGKPLVLVLLAGRPIALEGILANADAVMMAWHPGTMAGPALVDVLYGEFSPSGHLPVSWPKASGQIPVYYDHKSTGRPPTVENYTRIDEIDPAVEWQHEPGNSSNHLDYGHEPEFPFGYGLSYTTFKYSRLRIKRSKLTSDDSLEVSVKVKNTGKRTATDVVQLYIRDLVGDVTRPVKQLKAFELVKLEPGKSVTVRFSVPVSQFGFYNQAMEYVVEPGLFHLWVGQDSADNSLMKPFTVTEKL